jgi:hypothetical protein
VKDAKAAEGKNAVLVVRLSRAPTATVRVRFLTANGTARKGTDYLAKTGTLVFKRGQRVKRVTVKTVLETEPLGIFPVAGTKRTALAIFTITLSRASPQTITFDYAAVDNTATAGLDFNPAGARSRSRPGS